MRSRARTACELERDRLRREQWDAVAFAVVLLGLVFVVVVLWPLIGAGR